MEKEESAKSYNCVLSKGFDEKGYFKIFPWYKRSTNIKSPEPVSPNTNPGH